MISIGTMVRKHTIMIAMQALSKMTTASESMKNFLCVAVQKNYSIDIETKSKCLCTKIAGAFSLPIFHENTQKFTLSHKNPRDKNIPFYEGNRMRLKRTIPFILEVVLCSKTNLRPDW